MAGAVRPLPAFSSHRAADVIYVTLGTHEQPMDRLIRALEGIREDGGTGPLVIQHGYSRPPRGWEAFELVAPEKNRRFMERARVVITHGGPASIAEARELGKIPIVVPRRASFGEHVDDHQLAYARRMAEAAEIILVEDVTDLAEVVGNYEERARTFPPARATDPTPAIRRFGEIVDALVGQSR
jgi:UDP-N-acetylglucosamine transferase subunit ALG13